MVPLRGAPAHLLGLRQCLVRSIEEVASLVRYAQQRRALEVELGHTAPRRKRLRWALNGRLSELFGGLQLPLRCGGGAWRAALEAQLPGGL